MLEVLPPTRIKSTPIVGWCKLILDTAFLPHRMLMYPGRKDRDCDPLVPAHSCGLALLKGLELSTLSFSGSICIKLSNPGNYLLSGLAGMGPRGECPLLSHEPSKRTSSFEKNDLPACETVIVQRQQQPSPWHARFRHKPRRQPSAQKGTPCRRPDGWRRRRSAWRSRSIAALARA